MTEVTSALCCVERGFLKAVTAAVFLELPGVGEAVTAVVAGVQLHPGVDLHVRLQLVGLAELTAADLAFVRPLSSVEFSVSVKVVARPESFAALFARVPFLSGVQSHVLLQTAQLQESLPAHAAAVEPLLAVPPHVVDKRTFTVERLPTGSTDELVFICVAFLVSPQRTGARKTFVADGTAEGLQPSWSLSLLTRCCLLVPVHHLLVLQQFRVVKKCLSTKVTHKWFLGTVNKRVGLERPGS